MKKQDKTTESTAISGKKSEISQKKEVNIPRNSSLYFQIGLILCLLATYGLFEMNFRMNMPTITFEPPSEEQDPFHMPEINIVPDSPKPEPISKPVVMLTDKPPIVKPNDFVIKDPVEITTPDQPVAQPVVGTPTPKDNPTTQVETPSRPWNMNDVEKVPIFPGCESASNNAERMACMSEKLTKLIQRKFNTDLASKLGLSGVQKIYVQFKIDDKGQVTDIKSRSPYSQLESEAERVVSKIPTMTPGMQRDTPVSVIYNLPIVFQVH